MNKRMLGAIGASCLGASVAMVFMALYWDSWLTMLLVWPVWAAGYEMSVWSSRAWFRDLAECLARLVILSILGGIIWFGLLSFIPLLAAAIMMLTVAFCTVALLAMSSD